MSRSGRGHVIGSAVFRFYVLPFEVASVLLLAALVGAIVLTGREPPRCAAATSLLDRSGPGPAHPNPAHSEALAS